MKKNVLTSVTVSLAAAAMISGTAMAAEYKVGIIQFVDDASLNQIEQNIEKELTAKYVINAAGVFCDEIAALIGDDSIHTTPRKGEYMLCDKSIGSLAKHTIFQCPSKMGKGILVTPTLSLIHI